MFLRDEVSTIILRDQLDYAASIVAASLNIDFNYVRRNLELDNNRINKNINTKYSEVDAIYKNDYIYINIEVNTYKSITTDKKNFRYICNLILKQVPPSKKDSFKKIYQININDYDIFKENRFIYKSSILEENLHIKRNDFISIIDINLEYLRSIDYNQIIREEQNSLARLLYIFICEDKEKRKKLYNDDRIMEKVNKELEELTSEFGSLYYNKEEYRKEVFYELGMTEGFEEGFEKGKNEGFEKGKKEGLEKGKNEGFEKGIKKGAIEVAKNLLASNMPKEDIMKYTNLSIEEIEDLANEN